MGQVISEFIANLDHADEKKRQAKETLELLMKLADSRLDTFEAEIREMFLDSQSAMKTSVPGKRALRFERHVAVGTEKTPGEGVTAAVDAFFGAANSDDKMKQALDGFKHVVKTALSSILGDTSAGESYDKKFFVCIKHNAIVRVDMYTYKYNFTNKGIADEQENILAYLLCISVVDHRDVTQDELIYLASEFAGDGDVASSGSFDKYLQMLMNTWNALKAIDPLPTPGRQHIEYPSTVSIRPAMPAEAAAPGITEAPAPVPAPA